MYKLYSYLKQADRDKKGTIEFNTFKNILDDFGYPYSISELSFIIQTYSEYQEVPTDPIYIRYRDFLIHLLGANTKKGQELRSRYNNMILSVNEFLSKDLYEIYDKIKQPNGTVKLNDICTVYRSFDEDIDDVFIYIYIYVLFKQDKVNIELQRDYLHYIIPSNKKKTLADARKLQQQQQAAANANANNNNTNTNNNNINSNLFEQFTISGDQFFTYFNRYFQSRKYILLFLLIE